jgi:hypothetical protein
MCDDPNGVSLLVKKLIAALAGESPFKGYAITCTYDDQGRLVHFFNETHTQQTRPANDTPPTARPSE